MSTRATWSRAVQSRDVSSREFIAPDIYKKKRAANLQQLEKELLQLHYDVVLQLLGPQLGLGIGYTCLADCLNDSAWWL